MIPFGFMDLIIVISLDTTRTFYDLSDEYEAVAVVGIKSCEGQDDEAEGLENRREKVRAAIGAGSSVLQSHKVTELIVDGLDDPEAVAEGVTLRLWRYEEHKKEELRKIIPVTRLYPTENVEADSLWNLGKIKGQAQNLARWLADAPANLMTPTIFAEKACSLFEDIPSVEVTVRNKEWAEGKGMNAFLSVAKGSAERPVFLEIKYNGNSSDNCPIVLIGKGITFDTGGSNLKTTAGMAEMRGDKGGAACVLATTYAIAQLKIPINITTLIPLCENIIGGNANKPGDIITAMNGTTIRIDNTDAEGRLILADALCYATSLKPRFIVDVATLTGAMSIALGTEATGVFTNSNNLWCKLDKAGRTTGDRVWRMPLWKGYRKNLTGYSSVDLSNVSKTSEGGACTAAAFLKEFVPQGEWMHLDIAGVMGPNYTNAYLEKGMTGRPTRTLIEFLRCMS